LIAELVKDTSTRLFARLAGWEYPATAEMRVLADTYDLLAMVNSGNKKPKPYPRPWTNTTTRKKIANRAGRTPAQTIAILEMMKKGTLTDGGNW